MALILLIIVFISFNRLDFLGSKISNQIEIEAREDLTDLQSNDRIARTRRTFNSIMLSPFIGSYKDYESNKSKEIWDSKIQETGTGNAAIAVFAKKGLFVGLLFYYFYFLGIRNYINMYNFRLEYFATLIFFLFFFNGMTQRFVDDSLTNMFVIIGVLNFWDKNNKCIIK
jgi:hypothetical protein